MRSLTYFELDRPRCTRTYGSAPCTAAVGVTGDFKCANSPASCQDPVNYEAETQVIRFVESALYNDRTVDAIPAITDINIRPQVMNSGEDIGTRESGTVNFSNFAHLFTDIDPYWADRGFNPLTKGTLWGRLAAMYPNMQGYECRVIRGFVGQDIADMETSHYIIERAGPTRGNDGYQITFKDALKALDGNKALFPFPSRGVLTSSIDASTTPFNLSPGGIGSALNPDGSPMYPETGFASIGDEYFSYTRSGDVITPTARGLRGTEAKAHDAAETVQWAYVADALRPDEILEDLIGSTSVPAEYIQPVLWRSNIEPFNARLYSGIVAKPEPVAKLINELIKDVGLEAYTDVINKRIWFEQIRPKAPITTLTDQLFSNKSSNFLYEKRISDVVVYFALLNPLKKIDEKENYRAIRFTLGDNPNEVLQGNSPNIREHFSRWIPGGQAVVADFVADLMLGRYGSAPRHLTASVPTEYAPQLGGIYNANTDQFLNIEGDNLTFPGQVTSMRKEPGLTQITIEEYRANLFEPENETVISLDFTALDMAGFSSLRELYNARVSSAPLPGSVVRFVASTDVVYGSSSTEAFAVVVGDWPEVDSDGVSIQIEDLFIAGAGGNGGEGDLSVMEDAEDGGPALYTRVDVELINCTVGGGGGGGAPRRVQGGGGISSGSGGGGAGYINGVSVGIAKASPGTLLFGGAGRPLGSGGIFGITGEGGDLGQSGGTGTTGSGFTTIGSANPGAAGVAIDGFSYVTLTSTTVLGPTIN